MYYWKADDRYYGLLFESEVRFARKIEIKDAAQEFVGIFKGALSVMQG